MRSIFEARGLVCALVAAMFLFILSGCSLFVAKRQLHVAKALPPPVETPAKPDMPYCSVDLGRSSTNILNPKIYVVKHDRRLWVVNSDGVLVRDYLVGLGPAPTGDKHYIGDGRTPEGDFFICAKNGWSRFYKSLGLSYPDPRHAEQAVMSGLISSQDYRNIVEANEHMSLPPASTKLGGAIFIHGGGGAEDWTAGCIAVSDSAMDDLFTIISIGTPVCVMP